MVAVYLEDVPGVTWFSTTSVTWVKDTAGPIILVNEIFDARPTVTRAFDGKSTTVTRAFDGKSNLR